jgi:hypothetical protein
MIPSSGLQADSLRGTLQGVRDILGNECILKKSDKKT